MKHLALALVLLAAPAMAQDIETVTVNASSLVGTWYIASDPKLGEKTPLRLHCRVEGEKALTMACFERRTTRFDFKAGKLRMAWSPTLTQSAVIEAQLTSATSFAGHDRVYLLGISVVNAPLTGVKQEPDPQAPDRAGAAPLLRTILSELAHGALNRPYDARYINVSDEAQALRGLGPVTSLTYMGTADASRDDKLVPDFFSLYSVEFDKGRRFCGLHTQGNGMLDGLRCV